MRFHAGAGVVRRSAFWLLLALGAAGCRGGGGSAGDISRQRFVAANVAVRTLGDSASPGQRAEALRKHGVTDRQLRAWVRENAREPEVLAKAWEEIAFKLDSIASPALPGVAPPTADSPPGAVATPPGALPGGPPPPVRPVERRRPRPRPAPPAGEAARPEDIRMQ